MTPTFTGRAQTRIALALVPGLPVTALAAATSDTLTIGSALLALVVITVVGLALDVVWQLLQERRWDRDWPGAFSLAAYVPEALVSFGALRVVGLDLHLSTHLKLFTLLFGTALLVRTVVLPVLLPTWRHEGQRLLPVRRPVRRFAPAAAPTVVPAEQVADPATTPPGATHAAPRKARSLGGFSLAPSGPRLATMALFAGVVGAVVLLAPLLKHADENPAAASIGASLSASREVGATGTRKVWDTTERVLPKKVEFAAARLGSTLTMTLMQPNGVLTTPDEEHAAWYGQGAAPGQRGPAVLIGSTDAVFKGIHRAKPGEDLQVTRADGTRVMFQVDRVTTVDARSFPTQKVYGATPRPVLRLVGYDKESGRNTIVFAHAVSVMKAEG